MNRLADRNVVGVGAGFGGLATAAYLADAGAEVTVLEK
ncbi:MAG: NAD(P)-binding protein, partial [Halodesulfurarchaeum sp.]